MSRASVQLAALLRDPGTAATLGNDDWMALITAARAEQLIGSLALRLAGTPVPDRVRRLLDDGLIALDHAQTQARWEVEMARRALHGADYPVILMKGSAYILGGLKAGEGRFVGDLDIMVPRDRLDDAERRLLIAGWEWVKPDPYDDAYYREWMHELPPLIHRDRDRMIDVHHTILPLTARITPDAGAMIRDCVLLDNGMAILSPTDMVCHAVAHLLADGDLAGGMRNLWDIHQLLAECRACDPAFDDGLRDRAALHGLSDAVARAIRLADHLYGNRAPVGLGDQLFVRCFLTRDGWGKKRHGLTRFAFYLRSHWLRMPPLMLVRHLWIKWRKGAQTRN
jgi:hypothetical protein